MPMFNKQIRFTGKHAFILQKYSKDKGGDQDVSFKVSNNDGSEKSIALFDTRINCYMVAAMLGIIHNRKSDIYKNNNLTSNIFVEILNKQRANQERIYHHMILSNNEESMDQKIKDAFSIMPDDKCDEEQKNLRIT